MLTFHVKSTSRGIARAHRNAIADAHLNMPQSSWGVALQSIASCFLDLKPTLLDLAIWNRTNWQIQRLPCNSHCNRLPSASYCSDNSLYFRPKVGVDATHWLANFFPMPFNWCHVHGPSNFLFMRLESGHISVKADARVVVQREKFLIRKSQNRPTNLELNVSMRMLVRRKKNGSRTDRSGSPKLKGKQPKASGTRRLARTNKRAKGQKNRRSLSVSTWLP